MADIYRIRFELVAISELHKYCNADPAYFKNTTQLVPNSQIPDDDWYEVITPETASPFTQFNQLRKWSNEDREFVRNVRLERMVNEPEWTEIEIYELYNGSE